MTFLGLSYGLSSWTVVLVSLRCLSLNEELVQLLLVVALRPLDALHDL